MATHQTEIDHEMQLSVDFNYTPATPDVFYLPNGDPGYPGEPAELEVTAVWLVSADGKQRLPITKLLTSDQITLIEEDIMEHWEDPGYEDEPD